MLKELIKTKNWILDILMPKACIGCGREGLYICRDCAIFLSEADLASQVQIMSVWENEGLMKKLISKIKDGGCYDIIDELVDQAFEKIELDLPADTYITYVPMFGKKEKRQGFNHSEIIARKVGEKTRRPVMDLLEKVIDNDSQAGLSPQARIENMKGVFAFKKQSVCPENVLVVDDFRASGSTMRECFKVLKQVGAKKVWGFTLAREGG